MLGIVEKFEGNTWKITQQNIWIYLKKIQLKIVHDKAI